MKKLIKVAFVKNIPTVYNLPILERLCGDDRWDLSVYFCGSSHADRSWKFQIDHPKIHILKGWATKPYGQQWFTNHFNPGIIREILHRPIDVVVVGGYAVMTMQFAIALSQLKGIPYVINSETHSEALSGTGLIPNSAQLVKRGICKNSGAFLVTGTRVRSHLMSAGIPSDRIFVYPNTCDVSWFEKQAAKARENRKQILKKYGIGTDNVILFVGRLVEVKNVNTLIEAYSRINPELRNKTSLAIVGDGDDRHWLEQKALQSGLKNVCFLGHRGADELSELYGASDILPFYPASNPGELSSTRRQQQNCHLY